MYGDWPSTAPEAGRTDLRLILCNQETHCVAMPLPACVPRVFVGAWGSTIGRLADCIYADCIPVHPDSSDCKNNAEGASFQFAVARSADAVGWFDNLMEPGAGG